MTDYIFHTTTSDINPGDINDYGLCGSGLCFSGDIYAMGWTWKNTYALACDIKNDFYEIERLPCEQRYDEVLPLLEAFAAKWDISVEDAERLIVGDASGSDFRADDGELQFDSQRLALEIGVALGYKGTRGFDEQGAVYFVDMKGREHELLRFDPGMSERDIYEVLYPDND